MIDSIIKKSIINILPFIVVIVGLCGTIYLAVQQNIRLSANNPQIQIAEDYASQLSVGAAPSSLTPTNKVDLTKSLSPYVIIYGITRNVLTSSAQLNGKTPQIPSGVFDYVDKFGEDRITFQPMVGTRSAIVVTKYNGGYIVVGRSLREAEKLEDLILRDTVIACLCILITTYFSIIIGLFIKSKISSTGLNTNSSS